MSANTSGLPCVKISDLCEPWFEEIRRITWGVGTYEGVPRLACIRAIKWICLANGRRYAKWLTERTFVSRPRGRRSATEMYLEETACLDTQLRWTRTYR